MRRSRSGSVGTRHVAQQHVEPSATGKIGVFVRSRPLAEGEGSTTDNMKSLKLIDNTTIYLRDRFVDEKTLSFNRVFHPTDGQESVFNEVGKPACKAALDGKYGTVITYGQTGTGKTYTSFNLVKGQEGLLPRCVSHLFDEIENDRENRWEVKVQFLQLYKEQLSDLLVDSPTQLLIREDVDKSSVFVEGASQIEVNTAAEVMVQFQKGTNLRVVRLTSMNANSSRSHAIFMLYLKKVSLTGKHPTTYGRLTLVDLAGSERMKRSKVGSDTTRRVEAQSINMSLSCLGTVIHSLTDPKPNQHIPYRSCKLTRLLRDSLGEFGTASIIVTISPAIADVAETLGSLQFGSRALCVRQVSKIHTTVNHTTLNNELRERLTQLTKGNTVLEAQLATVSADNTVLREAAVADETLIEELEGHIKKVFKSKQSVKKLTTEFEQKLQHVKDSYEEKLRLVTSERNCAVAEVTRLNRVSKEREQSQREQHQRESVEIEDNEVVTLRSTLEQHRKKLEEAQVMLRQCRYIQLENSDTNSVSDTVASPPHRTQPLVSQTNSSGGRSVSCSSLSSCNHVEVALQSMQDQLDEERCSLARVREEYLMLKSEAEKLQTEKEAAEVKYHSLVDREKENERMKSEKREDRELLCSLIRERDGLLRQQQLQHQSLPSRSESREQFSEDRESIVGTFAAPPSETPEISSVERSATSRLQSFSSIPTLDNFFSRATIRSTHSLTTPDFHHSVQQP